MKTADLMKLHGKELEQCIEQAGAALKEQPIFPERMEIAEEFPGVDPLGKSSRTEMAFAERMQRLIAASSLCANSDVSLPDIMRAPMPAEIAAAGMEQRIFQRGVRLMTRNMDESQQPEQLRDALLKGSERQMEQLDCVKEFDMQLTAMEHLYNLREGPIPQEIKDFYQVRMHKDLDKVTPPMPLAHPKEIPLTFDTPDNLDGMQFFTAEKNWEKKREDFGPQDLQDATFTRLGSFCAATARRLMDTEFHGLEEKGGPDRENLVYINGISVRELVNSMDAEREVKLTAQERREAMNTIVGTAVQAGNRVDCFRPDPKTGLIDETPTPIAQEGHQPSPVDKPRMNRWQRFWSQHGFYQDKAEQMARYEEYQRSMEEASRTVQGYNDQTLGGPEAAREVREQRKQEAEILAARLKDPVVQAAIEKATPYIACTQAMSDMKDSLTQQIFGEGVTIPCNQTDLLRCGRSGGTVGLACLLQDGYDYADIMDPTKLKAEKLATRQRITAMVARNDPDEVADIWAAAIPKLQSMEVPAGLNPCDPAQFVAHKDLLFAFKIAQDIAQEMTRGDARPAMPAAFARISYNEARTARGEAPVTDWKAWQAQEKSPAEQAEWSQHLERGAATYAFEDGRSVSDTIFLHNINTGNTMRSYVTDLTKSADKDPEGTLHGMATLLVSAKASETTFKPLLEGWGVKRFHEIPFQQLDDPKQFNNRPGFEAQEAHRLVGNQLRNAGKWDAVILQSKDVSKEVGMRMQMDPKDGRNTTFKLAYGEGVVKAVREEQALAKAAQPKAAPAKGK